MPWGRWPARAGGCARPAAPRSRRPPAADGRVGQIHAVQANLRYPDSLAPPSTAPTPSSTSSASSPVRPPDFEAIHVEGPAPRRKAAREAGVETFMHISAIGADAKSRPRYARTKAAGEAAVLREFPGAIILRPSMCSGPRISSSIDSPAWRALAAAAADRRRQDPVPAGLRRRSGGGDRRRACAGSAGHHL